MWKSRIALLSVVGFALGCCLSLGASQDTVPAAPKLMDLSSVIARFSAKGYCASDARRFSDLALAIVPEELRSSEPGAPKPPPVAVDMAAIQARFSTAGFADSDASHFAMLALGMAPAADSGCAYYHVQEFYCDEKTSRWRDFYVGVICIRKNLPNCLESVSTPGEGVFFKTVTSSTCEMPTTCVHLAIDGPLATDEQYICDRIIDCSRWPKLACFTAERVRVDPESGHPLDCPECK